MKMGTSESLLVSDLLPCLLIYVFSSPTAGSSQFLRHRSFHGNLMSKGKTMVEISIEPTSHLSAEKLLQSRLQNILAL